MPEPDRITVIDPRKAGWDDRSAAPIFSGEVATVSGEALAEALASADAASLQSSIVRFEAGAHTCWHTHGGPQLLVVTEGRGHVGADGEDHVVEAGCVAIIPAGLEHYHGAAGDSALAHLAILSGGTELSDRPSVAARRGRAMSGGCCAGRAGPAVFGRPSASSSPASRSSPPAIARERPGA